MEKYVKAEMEVVAFETEDVIMTSGCSTDSCSLVGYAPDICGEDGHSCFDFGSRE